MTRRGLYQDVGRNFGNVAQARHVIRDCFLVEETILAGVVSEVADFVTIGHKQVSLWRSALRQLPDERDIEALLSGRLACDVVAVDA